MTIQKKEFTSNELNTFSLRDLVIIKVDSEFEQQITETLLPKPDDKKAYLYLYLSDSDKVGDNTALDDTLNKQVNGIKVRTSDLQAHEPLEKLGLAHDKPDWFYYNFCVVSSESVDNDKVMSSKEVDLLIDYVISIIGKGSRLLATAASRFYFEFSFDHSHCKPLAVKEEYRFYLDEKAKFASEHPAEYSSILEATKKNAPVSELENNQARKKLDDINFGGQIYRFYNSRFKHTYFSFKHEWKPIQQSSANVDTTTTQNNWFSQYRIALKDENNTVPRLTVNSDKLEIEADIVDINLSILDSGEVNKGSKKSDQCTSEQASYLLGFECKPASYSKHIDMGSWRCLLHAFSENGEQAKKFISQHQIWVWLKFNNLMRIVKPTFLEQVDEGKIANIKLMMGANFNYEKARELESGIGYKGKASEAKLATPEDYFKSPSNSIIARLASQFFTVTDDFEHNFAQFVPTDSRMFTLSHVTWPTCESSNEFIRLHNQKIFEKVKFIDTYEGFNYNQDFVNQLSDIQDYRRWDGETSYTSFNEFAITTMGFGEFAQEIQSKHWMRQYSYFIEYGLLTRYFLHSLGERIQRNTQLILCSGNKSAPDSDNQGKFRDLRRDFITFMNNYWFTEVSKEQQGRELFTKTRESLMLNDEFEQVKSKIDWADEFIQSSREVEIAHKANIIAILALALALIAMISSVDLDIYKIPWIKEYFYFSSLLRSWASIGLKLITIFALILLLTKYIFGVPLADIFTSGKKNKRKTGK